MCSRKNRTRMCLVYALYVLTAVHAMYQIFIFVKWKTNDMFQNTSSGPNERIG
jgi:hypothetical protein